MDICTCTSLYIFIAMPSPSSPRSQRARTFSDLLIQLLVCGAATCSCESTQLFSFITFANVMRRLHVLRRCDHSPKQVTTNMKYVHQRESSTTRSQQRIQSSTGFSLCRDMILEYISCFLLHSDRPHPRRSFQFLTRTNPCRESPKPLLQH